MNHKKISMFLLSLLFLNLGFQVSAQAEKIKTSKNNFQKKSIYNLKNKNLSEKVQEKEFDLNVGINKSEIIKKDGKRIDGMGFSFSGGKYFLLNNDFVTSSNIIGTFTNYNKNDLGISEGHAYFYEIGLLQRIFYNYQLSNKRIFRPFIDGGFSIGMMNTKESFINYRDSLEVSTKIMTFKLAAALGGQLIINDSWAPFLRFELARLNMKNNSQQNNFNGRNADGANNFENNQTSANFTLGIGYFF